MVSWCLQPRRHRPKGPCKEMASFHLKSPLRKATGYEDQNLLGVVRESVTEPGCQEETQPRWKVIRARAKGPCRCAGWVGARQGGGSKTLRAAAGPDHPGLAVVRSVVLILSPGSHCGFKQKVTSIYTVKRTCGCCVEEWTSRGQEWVQGTSEEVRVWGGGPRWTDLSHLSGAEATGLVMAGLWEVRARAS